MATPMLRPQQCRSGRNARASSWASSGLRSAASVLPRPQATTRPAPRVVSTTAARSRSATLTSTMTLPSASGMSGKNPSTTANSRVTRAERGATTLRETRRQDQDIHGDALEMHHLGRVLEDVLDAAVRDRARLHRGHQVAPAQRRTGRVELLVRRLMMLEGVHLGEVVATGDLADHADQRLRRVATIGVLLSQGASVLDLVGRAPAGETGRRQSLADRETADQAFDLFEQLVLRVGR